MRAAGTIDTVRFLTPYLGSEVLLTDSENLIWTRYHNAVSRWTHDDIYRLELLDFPKLSLGDVDSCSD